MTAEQNEVTGTTGYAYSSRDALLVTLHSSSVETQRYAPARGDRARYVRDCVTEILSTQAAIAREHARRVALCYSTPPSEVTPGPRGRGIAWARRPYRVVVRPSVVRGEYQFTVYVKTEPTGGTS